MTRVHQAYAGLTSNGPAIHNCNLSGLPRRAHGTRACLVCKHCLLKLNLRTSLFQLRLDFRGFVLVDRLFDRLGSPFDQVLGFLEPKARDRAHFLDHLDLLLAGGRKHDGELGLLLGSGSGSSRGAGCDRNRGGSRNAPLLFEELRKFRRLEHREAGEIVNDFLQISHDFSPSVLTFELRSWVRRQPRLLQPWRRKPGRRGRPWWQGRSPPARSWSP